MNSFVYVMAVFGIFAVIFSVAYLVYRLHGYFSKVQGMEWNMVAFQDRLLEVEKACKRLERREKNESK